MPLPSVKGPHSQGYLDRCFCLKLPERETPPPPSSPGGLWQLGPLGQKHGGKAFKTLAQGSSQQSPPTPPISPRPQQGSASAKSSSHHGSGRSSLQDIRNMWTTATLSQPKLNVQLPTVREDSELEDVSVSGKTLWSYDQKAGHDAEGGWEASDGGEDKDSFKPEEPEELELGGDSSQGSRLEEDDSKTDNAYPYIFSAPGKPEQSTNDKSLFSLLPEKPSSVSSLNISRHTPHRAYWVEQQSRLPLPLTELMENEALEILTEALRSYQSEIGRDHSLTKQLQRYIEGLKRRRNRRLQVLAV
nr:PREDICTED: testis-expressed sequence 40 protein [Bos indicus]